MYKSIFNTVLISLLAMGCTPKEEKTIEAPIEQQQQTPAITNCLIIVLDAFHAEHSSLYGSKSPTTPHLEKWAKRGVTFTHAYSQATQTLSSAWSYFNGQYPYQMQELTFMRDIDTPLPALFQNRGFKTAGFSENPFISKTYKFDKGFDLLEYKPYRVGIAQTVQQLSSGKKAQPKAYQKYQRTGDVTVELINKADDWITEQKADPWFCYLHLLRPHNPYFAPDPFFSQFVEKDGIDNPEEYYKQFELEVVDRYYGQNKGYAASSVEPLLDLYHSNIAYVDHLINEFLLKLETKGELKDTVVVIMSDHGEAFGEHGELLHGKPPHREQIHVPLVILFPETIQIPNHTIDTPVSLMDLAPTLEQLFDLTITNTIDGFTLNPLIGNPQTPHHQEIFSQHMASKTVALRQGNRKLLVGFDDDFKTIRLMEAYDLKTDPKEQSDIFSADAGYEDMLKSILEYVKTRINSEAIYDLDLTAPEKELLESIGYGEMVNN